MKSKIKQVLLIFTWIAATIGVARFCHHQTKGFALSKIQSNFPANLKAVEVKEEEKELLDSLFQQKFHFLGRGLQSFVFESEDKKYVLKLCNNRYGRKIGIFSLLSYIPLVNKWAQLKKLYYQGKLDKTFQSYQIAFEEMQDRTGLVYTHLNPSSNLPSKLKLVDPIQINHVIDLNDTAFLIQRRATLVYPALKDYFEHGDLDGAKGALSSLLELFFWKWDHCIADNDPLIRTNYGLIDGKAIQIDVGPLSKASSSLPWAQRKDEIQRITTSLRLWLNENAPPLTPFLDQELQEQLSSEGCLQNSH